MTEATLNIHNPYYLTEIEVTTEVQLSQEKGIGSSSQIRSPTVSNSLCPPIMGRYSNDEIQMVKDLYPIMTVKELAHKMGRKEGSLSNFAYKMGIKRTFEENNVTVSCLQCGIEFKKNKKRLERHNGSFCGVECRETYNKRNNIETKCRYCGKPMVVGKNKYDNYKQKIFGCSRECQHGEDIECYICGKNFHRSRGKIHKINFCSNKCHSIHRTGENNHNWKGGITVNPYGENWSKQNRKARTRDNNTCRLCGINNEEYGRNLDIHHIIPFRLFGRDNYLEANRLSNLITLCRACHMGVECEIGE